MIRLQLDVKTADFGWAPLEAKKAPWRHRPITLQRSALPNATEQQTLRTKREELARNAFVDQRINAFLEIRERAKRIEPVSNLQAPVCLDNRSLDKVREELRGNVKERPMLVEVDGKTLGTAYMVCPNSYDAVNATVTILRVSDPTWEKAVVQWNQCHLKI